MCLIAAYTRLVIRVVPCEQLIGGTIHTQALMSSDRVRQSKRHLLQQ